MKNSDIPESSYLGERSEKAVWSPPTLKDLGDVVEKTLGSPGTGSDGSLAS
ncbi:lasso RiPP family leader peptide-containing protein [Pelagicoccus sp. SDUM812002]|uniref:lasso RiPP family leader peptide-containing protein n=1 Tax=Pelagicoccus sp. SDUM812002 TaxID=3041266 RepID=UPI00281179FF|nr:lasso RiPP family leader peptide-containing protein [Pelagicoccus sp. SDUM812002]